MSQDIKTTLNALPITYTATTGTTTTIGTGTVDWGIPHTSERKPQKQSDLDHAVFKTPIEALVNLWIARYGSEWVDKSIVEGDEFFEWAALRLRNIGRLEEHKLYSEGKVVLRIVDKS